MSEASSEVLELDENDALDTADGSGDHPVEDTAMDASDEEEEEEEEEEDEEEDEEDEEEEGDAGAKKKRSTGGGGGGKKKYTSSRLARLPVNPVRRILRDVPGIGSMGKDVPLLISKAAELFIEEMTKAAYAASSASAAVVKEADKTPRAMLHYDDLASALHAMPSMRFLADLVPQRQRYGDVKEALAKQRKAVSNGAGEQPPLPAAAAAAATSAISSAVLVPSARSLSPAAASDMPRGLASAMAALLATSRGLAAAKTHSTHSAEGDGASNNRNGHSHATDPETGGAGRVSVSPAADDSAAKRARAGQKGRQPSKATEVKRKRPTTAASTTADSQVPMTADETTPSSASASATGTAAIDAAAPQEKRSKATADSGDAPATGEQDAESATAAE